MTGRNDQEQAWIILSDLFLDVDVTALVPGIITQLRALPFDHDQLETMLVDDLCPVCLPNLLSVAGIWQGFAPDDLITAIHTHRRRRYWFRGAHHWWHQRQVARMVPQWAAIRAALRGSQS